MHQNFESKFLDICSGDDTQTPFAGADYLYRPAPITAFGCARGISTLDVLGLRLSCPLRSYGAPLVPQEEQTPAAATDSTCIVYIYGYGVCLSLFIHKTICCLRLNLSFLCSVISPS